MSSNRSHHCRKLTFQILKLFHIFVIFAALAITGSSGQIGDISSIGNFAKKLLPEWMTKDLSNLISPTPPTEKRVLFKLNGPGFFIRKVPSRGLVPRPSKIFVKYAMPPPQQYANYKLQRSPGKYYFNHPYQFEQVALKPQLEYVFEKPAIPIAYNPAPIPYYPPPQHQQELHQEQLRNNFIPQFDSGPIHTIPAPNLAPQGSIQHEQIYENQPIYYPQHQLPQPEAQVVWSSFN